MLGLRAYIRGRRSTSITQVFLLLKTWAMVSSYLTFYSYGNFTIYSFRAIVIESTPPS